MKSSFVLCFTYGDRKCSIQICSSKRQNSGSSRSISLASEGTCVPKFTEVFLSHKWRQGRTGIWAGTGTVAAWKVIVFAHSGCKCPNACKYDCSLVSFSLNTNCRYIQDIVYSPLTNALQFHPHLKRSSITHKSLQYNYNNSCTYVKQRRSSCLDQLSTYDILHDI